MKLYFEMETITLSTIFMLGVDYGQLLMEEERDNEDLFDGFQCKLVSDKCSMPSAIAPRRQPHSREWRKAKQASLNKLQALIEQYGDLPVLAK